MTEERTRTVTWADPRIGANAAKGLSGLAYLEKMIRGELPRPPISLLLNFELTEVAVGHAVFSVQPAEYHYNPIGMVHGGLAATVLDSALGCAIHSTLPVGASYTTLELKLNLVRAIVAKTGLLLGTGDIIHLGGRTATAQARLVSEDGKLYAHATTTALLFRPEGQETKPQRDA